MCAIQQVTHSVLRLLSVNTTDGIAESLLFERSLFKHGQNEVVVSTRSHTIAHEHERRTSA